MNYWISWWHEHNFGVFELHTPWWISGQRADASVSICAAIRADNEETARYMIYGAYDKIPVYIHFRFCTAQPDDWQPFNERFPKGDWMRWC